MADLGREVKVTDRKPCEIPSQVNLWLNASGDESELQTGYKSSLDRDGNIMADSVIRN